MENAVVLVDDISHRRRLCAAAGGCSHPRRCHQNVCITNNRL